MHIPIVMANGSLSVSLDGEGQQRQYADTGALQPPPRIFRRGRRLDRKEDELLSLGHFELNLALDNSPLGAPLEFHAQLDPAQAILTGTCLYPHGIFLQSASFLIHDTPLLALQRTITNQSNDLAHVTARFSYHFDGPGQAPYLPPLGAHVDLIHAGVSSGRLEYTAQTSPPANGIITIKTTATNIKPTVAGNSLVFHIRLLLRPGQSKSLTFFLAFHDQLDGQDYASQAYHLKSQLRVNSFQALLHAHRRHQKQLWKPVKLILPDQNLTQAYPIALYHLLALAAPRQGFPDSLDNCHGRGRINGIHELFIVDALLHAGFPDQAMNASLFHLDTLEQARVAAQYGHGAAYFPLQVTETGTPAGLPTPWPGSLLQNAHIALAAWHCAHFTHHGKFLQDCAYPLLRAVAQFFSTCTLHSGSDDSLIVLPCQDFPQTESPLVHPATTAAIIATLDAATQASLQLDVDAPLRIRWASQSRQLLASTDSQAPVASPNASLPYPLLHAFPYNVPLATASLVHGGLLSPPLPAGHPSTFTGSSAWDHAWLAATYARLKMSEQAFQELQETAPYIGVSIQRSSPQDAPTAHSAQPWFAPAQATFILALTLMLLQSDHRSLYLLPAIPSAWEDVDVTLPAAGGLEVRIGLRARTITCLSVFNHTSESTRRLIHIPPGIQLPHPLSATRSYCIPSQKSIRII